jgi:hypothetical protein
MRRLNPIHRKTPNYNDYSIIFTIQMGKYNTNKQTGFTINICRSNTNGL